MVNLTALPNDKCHYSGMQMYCYPTVILQFREGCKLNQRSKIFRKHCDN